MTIFSTSLAKIYQHTHQSAESDHFPRYIFYSSEMFYFQQTVFSLEMRYFQCQVILGSYYEIYKFSLCRNIPQ